MKWSTVLRDRLGCLWICTNFKRATNTKIDTNALTGSLSRHTAPPKPSITTKMLHNTSRLALFCLFISVIQYVHCFAYIHCSHSYIRASGTQDTNAIFRRSRCSIISDPNNYLPTRKPCPHAKHTINSNYKQIQHALQHQVTQELCHHTEMLQTARTATARLARDSAIKACKDHTNTHHQHCSAQDQCCPSDNLLELPHRSNSPRTHVSNDKNSRTQKRVLKQVSTTQNHTALYKLTRHVCMDRPNNTNKRKPKPTQQPSARNKVLKYKIGDARESRRCRAFDMDEHSAKADQDRPPRTSYAKMLEDMYASCSRFRQQIPKHKTVHELQITPTLKNKAIDTNHNSISGTDSESSMCAANAKMHNNSINRCYSDHQQQTLTLSQKPMSHITHQHQATSETLALGRRRLISRDPHRQPAQEFH